MRKIFKLTLLALAVSLTASCEKVEPERGTTYTLSRETEYGDDWVYFSFAQGKEVEVTDHLNDLSWDIAFNRYNVRTNSGLSGKGKGGALDTGKGNLNDVTEVPAGEFTVDEMGKITENLNSFPPPEMDAPLNKLLCKSIQFQGPPPSYTPNNHAYIVRTADGKYAKIHILGFYDEKGESGYISFRYVYQPDGSTIFAK